MSAKKQAPKGKTRPPRKASTPRDPLREADAIQLIAGTLARHEASIRQLAEVVVNLHANVHALRDVIDALTARTTDPRVSRAKAQLRRVTLKE